MANGMKRSHVGDYVGHFIVVLNELNLSVQLPSLMAETGLCRGNRHAFLIFVNVRS